MARSRREFTPEYKDEAVKLVVTTGRAVGTVARELGINEATLGRWVTAKPTGTVHGFTEHGSARRRRAVDDARTREREEEEPGRCIEAASGQDRNRHPEGEQESAQRRTCESGSSPPVAKPARALSP